MIKSCVCCYALAFVVSFLCSSSIEAKMGIPKREMLYARLHKLARNGSMLQLRNMLTKAKMLHGVDVDFDVSRVIGDSLLVASRHGDLARVKYLVEEKEMHTDTYYSGNTPLHEASRGNHVEVARYLISKGADVHRTGKGRDGFTPLHYAASYGNVEVAELLLAHGADINAPANDARGAKRPGITPLHLAAEDDNNLAMVKFLVAKGAEVDRPNGKNRTPLDYAAGEDNYHRTTDYYGDYEPTARQRYSNNEIYKFLYAKGIEQGKFLHVAVKKMRVGDVQKLLTMDGVDVNVKHKFGGHTPLQGVAGEDYAEGTNEDEKAIRIEMARVLIAGGADVNLNTSRWQPLHSAIKAKNAPLVKLLLDNGADPFRTIHKSKTNAFHLANKVYEGDHEAYRILQLLNRKH